VSNNWCKKVVSMRRRKRGSVLIYMTVGLPALIMFCSLAVDWGRVQLVKTQLQSAADAAARHAMTGISYGVAMAQSRALAAAAENTCDGTPVVLDPNLDVEFGSWSASTGVFTALAGVDRAAATAIRVTAPRTSVRGNATPLVFGQVLGARTCDARAVAVATLSPSKYAVVGLDYVKMSGNSTSSYWSTSGSSGKGKLGNIASNGDITLSGSSYINGNARPGVGKQVYGAVGRVSGSVKPLTAPLSFPDGDAGSYAWSNDNGNVTNASGAKLIGTGDFSVANGDNAVLPGGIYYFKNVNIHGSLTFTGPATIYSYGGFNMSGNAYTNGNAPGNLSIVMCGASPGSVTIGSSTALYASVYAPKSAITLSGTGDIYGSVLGRSIDMTGTSGIHYDMSLEANGGAVTLVK
jgi:Flp pilus assembly protein TadG